MRVVVDIVVEKNVQVHFGKAYSTVDLNLSKTNFDYSKRKEIL